MVVTTYLDSSSNPERAAAVNTIAAFDLPLAYVRGEREEPGELPYAERFQYVLFPSNDVSEQTGRVYEPDPQADAVYVMRLSEALCLGRGSFSIEEFGEFVVARGL